MKHLSIALLLLSAAACAQNVDGGEAHSSAPSNIQAEALPQTGDAKIDAIVAAIDDKYRRVADAQSAEIAALRAENENLRIGNAKAPALGHDDLHAITNVEIPIPNVLKTTEQRLEALETTEAQHIQQIQNLMTRMNMVEGRATALEGRATAIEGQDATMTQSLSDLANRRTFPQGYCGMEMVSAETLGVHNPGNPGSMYFMTTMPCSM